VDAHPSCPAKGRRLFSREVQPAERGRAAGALHLPLGSAMTIERDGAGNIIGVKPRDI